MQEKSKRNQDDLQLIQKLSLEISSILELDKLLPRIMDAFIKAGKVCKGSIMLLNEDTNTLEIKTAVGLSEQAIKEVRPKLGEGIAGKVAQTGKPLLVNNTAEDKVYYKDFVSDLQKARPQETLLCLPLIFKNKILGVVNLDAKISGKPFFRNDEVLLSILANQAAVAIANAEHYVSATTDGLTKLYVHHYFQVCLTQEIERAKRYHCRFSLMLLDIDHFKSFNDTYGHQTGDNVLRELAKLLKSSVRASDLCARYGGEEFVIILLETDSSDTFWVGERLRKKIQCSLFTEKNLSVTVSIGVVSYSGERKISKERLINHVDSALYSSKNNGRNRVTVYERISE